MQAAIAPYYLEATELKHRREMAAAARKAMGIAMPQTPEEQKAMEAKAQQAEAVNAQAIMLDLEERAARIKKINAEAEKVLAEAKSAGMPDNGAAQQLQADVAAARDAAAAEINKLTMELASTRNEASLKEIRLTGEVQRLLTQIKSGASDRQADLRRAEIDREIAQINAEKDKEVARINADMDRVAAKMEKQINEIRSTVDTLKRDVAEDKREDKRESKRETEADDE